MTDLELMKKTQDNLEESIYQAIALRLVLVKQEAMKFSAFTNIKEKNWLTLQLEEWEFTKNSALEFVKMVFNTAQMRYKSELIEKLKKED